MRTKEEIKKSYKEYMSKKGYVDELNDNLADFVLSENSKVINNAANKLQNLIKEIEPEEKDGIWSAQKSAILMSINAIKEDSK